MTIHGHFYQPPRENPWSEEIETQESAAPFHDWNARINEECYRPNSASLLVDNNNRIIDINNNYEYLSFNIGPTLMSWLENHDPHTYARIINADHKSMANNNGHGNALAQIYNHMIMPLANQRDKITQIRWGIADFRHRFNREPEGMWLAETAINQETVECLIEEGIKFTVLSPFQADMVRPIVGGAWQKLPDGSIDPRRPYRIFLKDDDGKNYLNKYLDIFFYDGNASKAVAFEHLLKDARVFNDKLKSISSNDRSKPQLVHIGTDGESYGHHEKFGDMCLAYFFRRLAAQSFVVTNYANYLELFPPEHEVMLLNYEGEGTAWSCAHGVGRWYRDCGCSTGALDGWYQKWRTPLRDALDVIRDKMSHIYEKQTSKLLRNSWEARNDYVQIILNRSWQSITEFFAKHQARELRTDEKAFLLNLLEGQRNAMLMYTSCAWFFADISGIETVQVIKYAARAIQLYQQYTEVSLETLFLEKLKKAHSNLGAEYSGETLYTLRVKPRIIDAMKAANQYAINYLILQRFPLKEICQYQIIAIDKELKLDYKLNEHEYYNILFMYIETIHKLTYESKYVMSYTVQLDYNEFRTYTREVTDAEDFHKHVDLIMENVKAQNNIIPIEIFEFYGPDYHTIKDIYIEDSQELIQKILESKTNAINDTFKKISQENLDLIAFASSLGITVPVQFKICAEQAFEMTLVSEIKKNTGNLSPEFNKDAIELWKLAKSLKLNVNTTKVKKLLTHALNYMMLDVQKQFDNELIRNVNALLELAEKLDIKLEMRTSQNIMFEILSDSIREKLAEKQGKKELQQIEEILHIAEKLNFNVEEYQQAIP